MAVKRPTLLSKLVSLIALISTCGPTIGGDISPPSAKQYADNVSSEYAACAAYYQILSVGFERAGEMGSVAKADRTSELALAYSLAMAERQRSEEMARKVTLSRLEFYTNDMLREIENDISNVSILANKYANRCKAAIETPETFLDEVMTELTKQSGE